MSDLLDYEWLIQKGFTEPAFTYASHIVYVTPGFSLEHIWSLDAML